MGLNLTILLWNYSFSLWNHFFHFETIYTTLKSFFYFKTIQKHNIETANSEIFWRKLQSLKNKANYVVGAFYRIATQPADMTILLMLLTLVLTKLQNQTKLFISREIST